VQIGPILDRGQRSERLSRNQSRGVSVLFPSSFTGRVYGLNTPTRLGEESSDSGEDQLVPDSKRIRPAPLCQLSC
jgi:hypothetical protein